MKIIDLQLGMKIRQTKGTITYHVIEIDRGYQGDYEVKVEERMERDYGHIILTQAVITDLTSFEEVK